MGLLEFLSGRYKSIRDWIEMHYETYIIAVLCSYGFLLNFCPSQFFVIDYITVVDGVVKNGSTSGITVAEALGKVTPVRTYSALLTLLPAILLTDYVRYKPALIVQILAYLFGYSFLIGADSVGNMQFVEFLFGIGLALQIGQLTYGYASLQVGHYRKVSGYTRGYLLLAKSLSAVIGQIYISTTAYSNGMKSLTIVSLVLVILAGFLVVILPNIPRQQFVVTSCGIVPMRHLATINGGVLEETSANTNTLSSSQGNDGINPGHSDSLADSGGYQSEDSQLNSGFTELEQDLEDDTSSNPLPTTSAIAVLQLNANSLTQAANHDEDNNASTNQQSQYNLKKNKTVFECLKINFQPIWQDFNGAYSNLYIMKWSLWWFILTGVYLQVTWYSPHLWNDLASTDNGEETIIRKGSVEAVTYFIASLGTFFCAFWKLNWRVLSDIILTSTCALTGFLLIIMSEVSSLWFSYITYGVFVVTYHVIITVASFEIASQITTAKFALVFGFNNFVAGLLHLVLMLVFVVFNSDNPDFSTQMLLNGIFVVLTGVGYLMNIIFSMARDGPQNYLHNLKEHTYSIAHSHM